MTSIAVRERVYQDQPMMEPHRDFIGWTGHEFDPGLGVVEQLAQLHRYEPVVNPDVA